MGCSAKRHGTVYAYQRYGCRCPEVVAKRREQWRRYKQRQQPGRSWRETKDRSPYVDPIAVERACHGDAVRLTIRERALVVEQLTARQLSIKEIARRLGLSSRSVCRYRAGEQLCGRAA